MRKFIALTVAAVVASAANLAQAVPTAYYNPADGSIFLSNDTGAPLAVVNLKSPGGHFNGENLNIPGTTNDFGDKPQFLVYFQVPPTGPNPSDWLKVGRAVQGGGPLSGLDLAMSYFISFAPGQTERDGAVIEIPEPATIAIAGLGLVGIVAASRRRKA